MLILLNFFLNLSGVEVWRPFLLGQVMHICLNVLALLWDYMAWILILFFIIIIFPFMLVFLGNNTLEVQLGFIKMLLIIEIAGEHSILFLIYFDLLFSFFNDRVHVGFSWALLFLVNLVQRRVDFFLWFLRLFSQFRVLANDLELFNDIDSDGAQVTTDQGHATFLIARDKERAATAEAIPVMLTGHTIASIHRAKHVARELSDGLSLLCFGKGF